jgi:hypothetical protein
VTRLACVLAAAAVLGAGAATSSATTAPELILNVDVALTAKKVSFNPGFARRGNYVQFRVMNRTPARRTFSVAGRNIAIPARKVRFMAIEFDVRGRYHYVSRSGSRTFRGFFRVS